MGNNMAARQRVWDESDIDADSFEKIVRQERLYKNKAERKESKKYIESQRKVVQERGAMGNRRNRRIGW